MEIHLTPDQEAQLSELAIRTGTNTEQLLHSAVTRFLEDARFREAVERGEAGFERGEYLSHAHVGERIEKLFRG